MPTTWRKLNLLRSDMVSFLFHRETTLIWLSIVTFVIVFSAIGAWKLWAFGYNGFDLAIHRQVVEHSLRGDWFGFSLHPNKYIGDHFSPFHALLWPLYAVWKHPLTLIILQNIALALPVLPLARIGAILVGKPWHLIFVFMYLANPIIQNMALFEFHLLPFAIMILTLAILAYLQKKYWRFLWLCVLCLTIREDAALPIIGFGLLALADRRHWRWSIVPVVLGIAWLWFATKMTTIFGGYDNYKFLYYYHWLGTSFSGIIQTIVTRPWTVFSNILQPSTLGLALVVLVPFGFLPLWRSRWLVPAAPVLAQLLLMAGTTTVLVQIHYPAFFLPFFFVAAIAAWQLFKASTGGLAGVVHRNQLATVTLIISIIVYSSLALGPIAQSISTLAQSHKISDRIRAERALVSHLPPGGVIASMETLVDLSNRPSVYSLHYAFLGHRQFSTEAYTIPDDATALILDQRDFLFYQLLYPTGSDDHRNGYHRLRDLLVQRGFTLTANLDRFSLFEQKFSRSGLERLYTVSVPPDINGQTSNHGNLDFIGWTGQLKSRQQDFFGERFKVLPIGLVFTQNSDEPQLYQIEFSFMQRGVAVYRYQTTLGGGIYPSKDWPISTTVTSNYSIILPSWLKGTTAVSARVLDLAGGLGLNGPRSTVPIYTTFQTVGPVITLGSVDL